MAISMLKIRRPLGRLIFNMGIAIPGKTVFLIETAPCWWQTSGSVCIRNRYLKGRYIVARKTWPTAADYIFKYILFKGKLGFNFTVYFIARDPIDNQSAFAQVTFWCQTGVKTLLTEARITNLTCVCVTRLQCVNYDHTRTIKHRPWT